MPFRTLRTDERGSASLAVVGAAAALVGLATAIVGVTPALEPWSFADAAATSSIVPTSDEPVVVEPVGRSHDLATGTPTSIVLSAPSGAGGTRLAVSGEGFSAGERVVIRFDTDEVARVTADAHGRFADVAVTIPGDYGAFAPAAFTISATGQGSDRTSDALFELVG